ncbi:MAG: peptidase domain-containing ABC transporter [Acidisphaera sp.]|nr:peptidase domain-containing ABC transporter [Acidisphaera sp.]
MRLAPNSGSPSPAMLVDWLRNAGLWARADRLRWRNLMKLKSSAPVVLLFSDGSAGLLVGVNAARHVALIKDPSAPAGEPPVPVDELRLSQLWHGETLMMRPQRGLAEEEQPFDFSWIFRMVVRERRILRDIGAASLTLSVLTILPPLVVMMVIDRVVVHHSMSTLALISLMLAIAVVFETALGYARRELIAVCGTRLDTRLNLHVFNRMLGLPLDFFEKNPAGQTTHRMYQVYRVREFITGRMLSTFLDLFTLFVLLPFLFYLSATLSWMVLASAVLISMIIFAFLRPMRRTYGKVVRAETEKSTVLVETVHGIRTVKSLALEPQQKDQWDFKVANAGVYRLEAARLANWPNTLVTPIERFAERGVLLVGAYLVLTGQSDISIGALLAFMMLGFRVAQPLVSMARLLEEMEEVRAAIGEVGTVLNNPQEASSRSAGLRPRFAGALKFEDVTFAYPGTKAPALKDISFEVTAGTMLGIVGKSGSGKSTITRLLQGINRTYDGYLKIDGIELREIDLPHLRRSFGVVLQDNFLFRGSVRDNIIASRPGLTIEDAVRAARLAGAEEFIERMPAGYETIIEEGSPNLSGGQKQRLAIARALICDPRILILDEATSALDPESEALVNANLLRIARGRTMVIVSHRLSSLTECDQILVLDKGKVMDLAPHPVLVERCAVYRQLWLQQNRHMEKHGNRPTAVGPVLAQGD